MLLFIVRISPCVGQLASLSMKSLKQLSLFTLSQVIFAGSGSLISGAVDC